MKLIVLTAAASRPALFSSAVIRARMTTMSWLSVGLRNAGLGGIVDVFDGVEGVIKTAVATNPAAATLEHQTVAQLGSTAQAVTTAALAKILPDGAQVAPEVTAPFFAGLEAYVNHFFSNGTTTTTVETDPPKAA